MKYPKQIKTDDLSSAWCRIPFLWRVPVVAHKSDLNLDSIIEKHYDPITKTLDLSSVHSKGKVIDICKVLERIKRMAFYHDIERLILKSHQLKLQFQPELPPNLKRIDWKSIENQESIGWDHLDELPSKLGKLDLQKMRLHGAATWYITNNTRTDDDVSSI